MKTSKGCRAQRYEGAEGVEVRLQALLRFVLEVQFSSRSGQNQAKLPNRQQEVYYDCTKNCVNIYRELIRRTKECLLNTGPVLWNLKRIKVTYSTNFGTLIFYGGE